MPFDKKSASEAGSKSKRGKSTKTKQWEALGESIMEVHTDRFNDILSKSNDTSFVDLYLKILEYFQPKLQRSDIDIKSDGEQINIPPITFFNNDKDS